MGGPGFRVWSSLQYLLFYWFKQVLSIIMLEFLEDELLIDSLLAITATSYISTSTITMLPQSGDKGGCFDQADHGDQNSHAHLPLHVHFQQTEKYSEREDNDLREEANASIGGGSDCTNPHLRDLMNRHFSSGIDAEDCCDADGEASDSDSSRRPTLQHQRLQVRRRRRRTNADKGATPSDKNDSISDSDPSRQSSKGEANPMLHLNGPPLTSQLSGLTTDGETKAALGDSSRFKFNAWDSSQSTICDDDHNTSISFDAYFNPIGEDENEVGSSLSIRKTLFPNENENENENDNDEGSRTPDIRNYNHLDVDNNSDLELTQRSRQIQWELRLQEMSELAREAEIAAEEGKEKFVGNATKFELGLGLDVDNDTYSNAESPKQKQNGRSWKLFDNLDCNSMEYDAVTPLRGSNSFRASSQTDIKVLKRPSTMTHGSRQSSAPTRTTSMPSMAGRRKMVGRPSLHSMPSILSSATFLSVAPTKDAQEKISVLALRHIDEVIPTFKEMHPFMKQNMHRCGVKAAILNFPSNADAGDDGLRAKENGASRRGSFISTISVPFFHRAPSFNVIIKSISGLSIADPENGEEKVWKSDDEISYRNEAVLDSDDTDLSVNQGGMTLDCVSFVSCGDISDKAMIETSVKRLTLNLSDDDEVSLESDHLSSSVYACTLATEVLDPTQLRRSLSPLPQAPFHDDEEDLQIITPTFLRTPTSSRWSTLSNFWDNISPAKRHISLPSPIRLGPPGGLETRRNSWVFANESLPSKASFLFNHGGQKTFLATENEPVFHLTIDGCKDEDEPWELQKDDASDGIIISSQSFTQTIPRAHSPCECCNDSRDNFKNIVNCDEAIGEEGNLDLGGFRKTDITDVEEHNILDEEQTFSEKHFYKCSFRTFATQLSGDDSQSSYSKLSLNSAFFPGLLTPPLEDNPSDQTSDQPTEPSTLPCSASVSTFASKDQDIPDKPPLHPIVASRLTKLNLNPTFHRINTAQLMEKVHILPTIQGSLSCPDFIEASSSLSITASEAAAGYDQETFSENSKILCCNMTNEIKCADSGDISMYDHWRNNDWEERESNRENLPILNSTNEPTVPSLGLMEEEPFAFTEPDENNKSMSFKGLIEKVPSVIGRFRPFRKEKEDKPEHKDDAEFVRNYFFTGVKIILGKSPSEKKTRSQAKRQFGTNPCIDFNCESVFESALTCLSKEPSRVYVNHTDSRTSLDSTFSLPCPKNRKYGNLNTHGRIEQIKVANRVFNAPSLKTLKRKAADESDLNQSFDSGVFLPVSINAEPDFEATQTSCNNSTHVIND